MPPRRALLIRTGGLGDLICALPLYRTLQTAWPETQLDWLLGPRNACLGPYLRANGEVFSLPRLAWRRWIPGPLLRALQAAQYDLCLNTMPGFDTQSAWLCMAVGAHRTRGCPSRTGYRGLNQTFTEPVPAPNTQQHQVVKCLELIKDWTNGDASNDISLDIPTRLREAATVRLPAKPFAVLQISTTKRDFMHWPENYFVDLGRMLIKSGLGVIINAVPSEADRAQAMTTRIGPDAKVTCLEEMGGLLALLASAKLVVGSDGGGIHLAAAVGTHTVAFYAETNPLKWRPWQGHHIQFFTERRVVSDFTPAMVMEKIRQAGWLDVRPERQ